MSKTLRSPNSATTNGSSVDERVAEQFGLSIVVPTRNEAGNVAALVTRIESALQDMPGAHLPAEIIFVDDSDDETPEAIRSLQCSTEVRLVHRTAEERSGGLGGAVVAGMAVARAPWVCVMDGDLQHPPEALADMARQALVEDAQLVVASRFCNGGDIGNFSRMRQRLSRICSTAASVLFRRHLERVSDPLSGYFLVRLDSLQLDRLRPQGFKILLEILVRTPSLRVAEVPFQFGDRHAGETKASSREALRFVTQLARLRVGELAARFGRFGVVGATGLAVNMLLLALLTDVAGLYYVAGAILATQGSTLWNFAFTELWVFADREHKHGGGRRLAMFLGVNNAGLVLRVPILVALTSGLGVNYLISNFASLIALTLLRFAVADLWIWAREGRAKLGYSYDIHGLITVASDVRLPELARFRVDELFESPDVEVRIGDVRREGKHGVTTRFAPNGNGMHFNGSNGHAAGSNGHAAGSNGHAAGSNGHVNGSNGHVAGSNGHVNGGSNGHPELGAYIEASLRYTELLGRYGFAVDITDTGDRMKVLAAPLLRRSPHVLYTNVVEPILRWTFVRRGYALVHAACFADGERAYMITARTDTGKTTTMLKTLDRFPYSFISDDLTVLCPDGRVLAYPKPLTISQHTVQAVKAANLSRKERLGLIFQSRLHSRGGRRIGLIIAKLRIPAATLNAVTQLVIPPPKYHVERLIPGAEVAPEARLAGLFIIQRGGVGEDVLDREEALEILLSNCDDAYGFPPYPKIEGWFHSREGSELKPLEQQIIEKAVSRVPAVLMRSETMDWAERLPGAISAQVTDERQERAREQDGQGVGSH
jgi:putative flippase GtrA